tara:strand:- start:3943 stop:4341 length:399 start_codon:yes stop_codon:yes gene_type:complete
MNHELLNSVRLGILVSQRSNGQPIGVPIWFDWNGETIQFFAGGDSKKVKRLEMNPDMSLLVTNNVGEPEGWIAFDGQARLCVGGGIELAETLALRYWDMDKVENQTKLAAWKAFPDAFVRYEMKPEKIRQGS